MIKRVPWLRRLKKADLEAPLRLPMAVGPVTNGEAWWPDSPRKALIRKLVLEKAEEVSRREGIDRREFMASACGMATTLYMINAVNGCATSHGERASGSAAGSGSPDGGMAGAGNPASAGAGSASAGRPGLDPTLHDRDAGRSHAAAGSPAAGGG